MSELALVICGCAVVLGGLLASVFGLIALCRAPEQRHWTSEVCKWGAALSFAGMLFGVVISNTAA